MPKTLEQEFAEAKPLTLEEEFDLATPVAVPPRPASDLGVAQRDVRFAKTAVPDVVEAAKVDALRRQRGEESELQGLVRGRVEAYKATREQTAGGPPVKAPAVQPSGIRETPGVIRNFLEAGMRPAGAAIMSRAEQAAARIRRENPGMDPKEVNRRVVDEMTGPLNFERWALTQPGEALETAKQAAFAYHPLDPSHPANVEVPTIIKAMPKFVEQYGEEKPATSEPIPNMLRAMYHAAEGLAPTLPTAISRIAEGKSPIQSPWRALPPAEETSTKSIEAPWGRMGAETARDLGMVAAFTPAGDVSQLVLGGTGRAVGGAAKVGGDVAAKVAPRVAGAVNRAGEAAASAMRTSGPGRFFLGTPATAELIAKEARRPEKAAEITHALQSIGPRQMQELQPVMEAVKGAKNIKPSEWPDIWATLQGGWMKAQQASSRLSPEAKVFVNAYHDLRLSHGASMLRTAGTKPRAAYASERFTPEAMELAEAVKTPVPPTGIPSVAPLPSKSHRHARVKIALNKEARLMAKKAGLPAPAPIETIEEMNAAINAARGRYSTKVQQVYGKSPVQSEPGKNIAQRFGEGALEKPWAETIADTFAPLALRVAKAGQAPKGWQALPATSLAHKVLEHSVKGTGKGMVVMPKAAVDAIAKGLGDKSALDKVLGSLPIQAWKSMVTTLSGLAYHSRNFLYNLGKLADEFRVDELLKAEKQMVALKSGSPGFTAIIQEAKNAGTWAGTGGAPGSVIKDLRLQAGLPSGREGKLGKFYDVAEKTRPARAVKKVYQTVGDLATRADEEARMRAILGYVNRGMDPRAAVQQSKRLITWTGDKTPFEKATGIVSPFATWTLREAPKAGERMAGGGLTWPVKIQGYMESKVPAQEQVPERFQPRRFREQSGVPLGGRTPQGLSRGVAIPASPVGPVSQMFDAPILAAQGAPGGEVLKAGARTVANQLYPPAMWLGAEAGGTRPLTNQPLGSTQRATSTAAWIAETFPDIGASMGIERGADGEWYMPSRTAMYLGVLPYGYPARIASARDPAERRRALISFLTGVPVVPLDPSRENQAQSLEQQRMVTDEKRRIQRLLGIPKLP